SLFQCGSFLDGSSSHHASAAKKVIRSTSALRRHDGRDLRIRVRRSGLAASLGAEDAFGFPQEPLDVVPKPRERLRSASEGKLLDLVRENAKPPGDCGAPSLQLA